MKKILVVDDEFDLLETICATLEMGGYQPIRAGNGREALDIIDDDLPDMVLTDVMMPYVSGYELVAALRNKAHCRDLPTVIMSAMEVSQHPEGTWKAVLKKPFSLDALLGTVERIVGK